MRPSYGGRHQVPDSPPARAPPRPLLVPARAVLMRGSASRCHGIGGPWAPPRRVTRVSMTSPLPDKAADTSAEQPWPVRVLSLKISDYVDRMSQLWVEGQV